MTAHRPLRSLGPAQIVSLVSTSLPLDGVQGGTDG
ncbi:hypothetical protein [Caudoviricetes sp.]|nr:hypothetical protein [Caudoviricetes sp.]UOF82760.1 hypothetical protein [Caudoviricetes sp.]